MQQAQAQVGVARAKLAQVKAGPKPEEVQAKEALINRSEAEVRAAERDLGRASHPAQTGRRLASGFRRPDAQI